MAFAHPKRPRSGNEGTETNEWDTDSKARTTPMMTSSVFETIALPWNCATAFHVPRDNVKMVNSTLYQLRICLGCLRGREREAGGKMSSWLNTVNE